MKTKEEIKQLAQLTYPKDIDTGEYCGFIKGYTQCQKDMAKELEKETLDELFEAHEPEDFIDENYKNWWGWEKYKQD